MASEGRPGTQQEVCLVLRPAGLSLCEMGSVCYSSLSCTLCCSFCLLRQGLRALGFVLAVERRRLLQLLRLFLMYVVFFLRLLRQGLRAPGFVPAVERRRLLQFGPSMNMQQTVHMQSSLREHLCSVFCFLASAGLLGPLALWPLVNVGVSSNLLQVFVMYFCCWHTFSELSADVLPWGFEQ